MPILAFVLIIIMAMVEASEEVGRDNYKHVQQQEARSLGGNMLVVRNALQGYAQANPSSTGNIPLNLLGLPAWFKPQQNIYALIQDGRGYVYFTPRHSIPNLTNVLGTDPPALSGVAWHQTLVSPRLNSLISLPESIPENSIVLML